MTDYSKELLNEKLAQCARALSDLKRYQKDGTLEYLRAHPDIYYAVCYRFIGLIEALFDVGQILLASRGLRAASELDIPVLLGKELIISTELMSRFSAMYGFRNRLVHAYGTLDDEKVAEYLAKNLDDITAVLKVAKGDLEARA